jgi:tetratricopeptide (TPR) repeat protein
MNRSRAWFIGIVVLILGTRVAAGAEKQQPASAVSQAASDAATAYDGKDWPKSAKLYAQIVETVPNPRAWYRLGVSLNKIGENDKAIEAFERGRALGLPPQFAEYGIAVVFASKREKDKAFEHLEKAAQNGLRQPDQLSADPDLADLKSDTRFAKILEEVTRNQKPCAGTPENRQFDYWLGEWRVVTTQGETPPRETARSN